MCSEYTVHIPVLRDECIAALNIKENGFYADCTAGFGGHSCEIAKRLTTGKLLCIDRDSEAIKALHVKMAEFGDRVVIARGTFGNLPELAAQNGFSHLDGVLIDLGVSSLQLDDAERGFSYNSEGELDMRMDRDSALSAYSVVNGLSEKELTDIFYKYGEEKFSPAIARRIVAAREKAPIKTTLELSEIIKGALPPAARREKHPAKRVFQAIRVYVNDEQGELVKVLNGLDRVLADKARVAIISFNSLDDRIVKKHFIEKARNCTCPPSFPVCVCGGKATFKIITKHPVIATDEELAINNRAKSAKLRVAEFIKD